MDCTEVDNGYKVRYTPLVNGDYYIHVKYNNVHISGSPWKRRLQGFIKGPRPKESSSWQAEQLHHQRFSGYTEHSTGRNILYVGVYGFKGPCDEVSIKHISHYNNNVGYKTKDRGQHFITIRYGNDHIPGSPFPISA
ncbi:Filamin/ABP280 repeat-like [Trinorchestia longiramus]|nr:Filamin/ABP280 repeat-like [Trinorchestia longiramus]